MCDSLACRLCLATDVRLTAIATTPLQDMYEKLTNIALYSMEKPTAACYLCVAQLKKCQEFTERVIRADELLIQMLQTRTDITSKSIAMIDREAHKLSASLAITHIEYYDMDYCQPVVEVKKEVPCEEEDMGELQRENEVSPVSNEIALREQSALKIEYKKEILIINDCGNTCNNEWILPDHIECDNAIREEVNLNCDLCPNQCNSCDCLEKHAITHNKDSPSVYIQDGLSKTGVCCRLSKKNNLESLIETQTENPSECKVSEYRCSVTSDLNQDLGTLSGKELYKCTVCEYSCGNRSNLEKHLRTHSGWKPYKCMVCEYRCNEKGDLKTHIRRHTGEKPFECTVCEYRACQKSALKQHLRTHTGEKPFQCPECKYRCSRSGDLKRHFRTHTGEKPFQCTVCEYRCNQRSTLRQHSKTHSGDIPLECTVCHKTFAKIRTLRVHLKTHSS